MDRKRLQLNRNQKIVLLVTAVLLAVISVTAVLRMRVIHWKNQQSEMSFLVLINKDNPVPTDIDIEFTMIDDENMVDARCAFELEQMLSECRQRGFDLSITHSFLTEGGVEELIAAETERARAMDGLAVSAEEYVSSRIAHAGCNEHQTGFAVDIEDNAAEDQEKSAAHDWLRENSWRYGFILRYDRGREAVTGYGFNPTHYRYVGVAAAEQIHELDMTLEEYINMFYK